MTKRLECFIEGCTAAIEADTEDVIMEQAASHAADAHPELELDEATLDSIRGAIQDV
jgi:predicted small metal-binding protein